MAIIYSYPLLTGTAADDDLLLITDKSDGDKTKSIKISQLPSSGGGSTSPATPLKSVQFNNAGAFGGSSNFLYDDTTKTLTIGDQDVVRGVISIAGGGSGAGELRLGDPGTSGGTVTLKGGTDHATSYTIKLPDDGPSADNKILQSDASGNLTWVDKPSSGINSCAVDTPALITGNVTNNAQLTMMYQHVWTGGEYQPGKAKIFAPSSSVISGKVGIGLYKGELADPTAAAPISFTYADTLDLETGFKMIELQNAGNGAMSAGDNCVFVFFMAGDGGGSETYGSCSLANNVALCAQSTFGSWPTSGSAPTLQSIVSVGLSSPRVGVWMEFYKS